MKRFAWLFALAACSSPGQENRVSYEPLPKPSASPSVDASADTADPAMSSKESKQVARTLERVTQIRGLKSTKAVPGVKLDRDQLVARVKEKALREYPPEQLRREGQLLQIMGFAPTTFDYLGEMMKLLEAQLEGFYEPKNGTMYLASDLRGDQAKATLAHELVHALQDQHWDLKTRSQYRPGKGDESMALASLAEGDATSAMLDYILAPAKSALDMPDDMLRELMKSGMNMGDVGSVPHILKTTLIAPYSDGLAFVQALRRKGGWAAVDHAWDKMPTTTEQILHVEKWEAGEVAMNVPAPSAVALGADWKRDDEDSFGELGFALAFAEWMDGDDARIAAAGWGGDRSAVYTKGAELAIAVHLRYDPGSSNYADRAIGKLFPAMKKKMGKPAIGEVAVLCFERADTGPLYFAKKDRDLVMIVGPAKASGSTWTSTSSCAQARKWGDEVLGQK
ncbi:MAG TPA: hypothetical protein VIF62_07400 [Labilithrix sp.]